MEKVRAVIRYLRPCQRALQAIDANLEATQELQDRLAGLESTIVHYVERHGPDEDGVYRRRSEDPTGPPA